MGLNVLSFTQDDAIGHAKLHKRANQVYMKRFDVDVVLRKGKLDNPQIDKIRYREDHRPMMVKNNRTGEERPKRNDIVTYRMPGSSEPYILAKSGGVSLFDGISSKVPFREGKDAWWIITKDARLEPGLIIAKDMFPDAEGNTHYSIEAEIDMPVSEYFEKLAALKKYMRVK
ncbi:hypothetical protein [Microbulbifer sp. PSTR4-B]|uniref:hypothetical protein n=1 Tax=Microbulbifer sp. PSTR4-B TaxID=3243396 RepID=UPI0040399E19